MLLARRTTLAALSFHLTKSTFIRQLPRAGSAVSLFSIMSATQTPLVWNKESTYGDYSTDTITQSAKIVSIADMDDPANEMLHKCPLPSGCELVKVITSVDDIDLTELQDVNAVFCSHGMAREPLAYLLQHLPNIVWVHTRSAGIDFVHSEVLAKWDGGIMTNAKGQFSSTLAEYSLGAMTYFAKDFARLERGKAAKAWDKYVRLFAPTHNL